jgi:hypothetical protein
MSQDYQYVRYQEVILPGQTYPLHGISISDTQIIEVKCDSAEIVFIAEDLENSTILKGLHENDSQGWVTLVDTDSGILVRRYRILVSNLGSSEGKFSLRYSCPDQGPVFTMMGAPSSDGTISGTWTVTGGSGSDYYAKLTDPAAEPDDDSTYITGGSSGASSLYLGFDPLGLSNGSSIRYVRVYYRVKSTGSSTVTSALNIGGSVYESVDPGNAATTLWTTYYYDYTTNPATGEPWTINDFNGVVESGLQEFGIVVDGNAEVSCTQCYIEVSYSPGNYVPIYDISSPMSRRRHSMVYNSDDGKVYVFGGFDENLILQNDIYAYTPPSSPFESGSWETISVTGNMPDPRCDAGMVFDPVTHKIIVIGGATTEEQTYYPTNWEYFNDIWTFDPTNSSWTEQSTSGTSPDGYSVAYPNMCYYECGDNMIFYLKAGTDVSTLYKLNTASWFWDSEVIPGLPYAVAPCQMTADPARGQIVLLCGLYQTDSHSNWWPLGTFTLNPSTSSSWTSRHQESFGYTERATVAGSGKVFTYGNKVYCLAGGLFAHDTSRNFVQMQPANFDFTLLSSLESTSVAISTSGVLTLYGQTTVANIDLNQILWKDFVETGGGGGNT